MHKKIERLCSFQPCIVHWLSMGQKFALPTADIDFETHDCNFTSELTSVGDMYILKCSVDAEFSFTGDELLGRIIVLLCHLRCVHFRVQAPTNR